MILGAVNSVICNTTRINANKQDGFVSDDFQRLVIEPRADYRQQVEKYNLKYHNDPALWWKDSCELGDPYWGEQG